MSRKQLATAYRGYHGLEAQYHAMVRMSDEAMMNAKARNDHIHLKHNADMKHLEDQRRTASRLSRREIESISEEFRAQLAYQYVYKNHSFKKIDPTQSLKKARPASDKPEMYGPTPVQRATSGIRPLGSLRQMENYKNELRFPPLNENSHEKEREKSKVNMLGDKQYNQPKEHSENITHTTYTSTKSFPKIEGALGVEIKYKYKLKDDDKDSLYSAPAGVLKDETVEYSTEQAPVANFDMGKNLLLMRQREQDIYSRQRQLPVPPPVDETKKQGWRRVLPATPTRPSSVYPRQETNVIGHKKAMSKEVSDLINTWNHANTTKRMEIVEKVKQLEKDHRRENPPPTFDRSRPTSAILREFKEYKKLQEELKQKDENQPITVRQLNVQPRPETPSVVRRNQYSAKIQTPGKLRRTASERTEQSDKISSVSTTCPTITVNLEEIAANALMTAAERIEKEIEKRDSAKQRHKANLSERLDQENKAAVVNPSASRGNTNETNVESNEQKRRVLPKTPGSSDGVDNVQIQPSQTLKYNTSDVYMQDTVKPVRFQKKKAQMFDTSILAKPWDRKMIEEVHKANVSPDTSLPLKKLRPGTPGSLGNEEDDDVSSNMSTSLYMFSAKPIPQNIKQRMKFEYDNYSRTTPNTKKKLEIRAKNRRKIQQQNKLLKEERKDSPMKDIDRASTQVSFNENVMVFQTI